VKKLGEEIPDRYCVFVHNVYENNIFLGKTSFGTPVAINREVMKCDFKVAIGGIIPHSNAGFGGGSKIIHPGVASIDSIEHNHKHRREGVGEGRIEGNTRRFDSEEAARLVGIDFIVNMIINPKRDCCELVCGDVVEAHRVGVKMARKHYRTKIVPNVDLVVVNGYPMECEAYKALSIATQSVRDGGDVVLLLCAVDGARGHYYFGRFGMDYGGRGWSPDKYVKKSWKMDRIIVMAPHHSLADEIYYGSGSLWVKSWDKALNKLHSAYSKTAKVKAALYPYAPIQISEKNADLH
jgi:nickel-dependent lactate racemase